MVKRYFFIFLLISLVGFLILPKISLANEFEKITLEKIKKYLQLPEKDTQNLLFTLKQVFTTDWIYRESFGSSTDEERLIPLVLRKIIRIQALNHLLIDAPIQTTWLIVKNATKIARVFLAQDPSVVLNELEKESVKKANEYAMSYLLQNEIRVTPGAIEYAYISQGGVEQMVIIQYILIYQPLDNRRGNVIIRFYSPQSIEPPKSEGSMGVTIGTPHSVQGKLPPFIVEITGKVEKDEAGNYWWIDERGRRFTEGDNPLLIQPTVEIILNEPVPDLGIKPLTFWEKYVLKPIESRIKEVEIIITKITGGTSNIAELIFNIPQMVEKGWDVITSTIKAWAQWGGAQVGSLFNNQSSVEPEGAPEPLASPQPQATEQKQEAAPQSQQLTLAELQEMLDDIAEKIDILSQKFAELIEAKKQQTETEEIEEDEEEDEEETEDLEKKEVVVCSVNINTASKEELQKITGVGPVIAQRIIEARPFYSLYELTRVSGIGEITLQKIISQGCAYVESIYAGSGAASLSDSSSPQITLSYLQNNPVNQEIQVTLSASNLKNTNYDVKISIEKEKVFSDIYNENENKWQSSFNYLISVFSGTSFSGNFKLKIKNAENSFREEADIIARVRENGKSSYLEFKGKINIADPEQEEQEETPPLAVVINEVAWMGTATSSNDEWIELHNTTKNEIDLTDWTLVSITDGSPDITLSGTISPFGFYLLERTNDDPVKDILADWKGSFGSGGLKDTGEELELRDGNGNSIDKVGCQKDSQNNCISWFAGKKEERISMERINPRLSGENSSNWANNNPEIKRNGLDANRDPINGTAKAQNSVYQSLSPEAVLDLTIDETKSENNIVFLAWSVPNDPDTLPENLSYEIYYLKESLNEDNLEQASVASTTAATTSISDLDYNSDYYFGIKAFDGENYSELSNVVSYQIISALVNSPWLAFRKNLQRSGQSDFLGPQTEPTVIWIYNEEVDLNDSDRNPLYTSPVVRAEGAIFSSVIFPTNKKGILALNPDGSKKWFQDEDIDFPLALQPDGSVLADDISRAWSEDKTAYYLGQDDTLYAFDKDGNERWQRQFEFIEPQQGSCASTTPSVLTPAVSNGVVYAVVQNNSCLPDYKLDYLYALSAESGNIIWQSDLGGYNSSLPTVSTDDAVYIFSLTYPKYAFGPTLWLKAVFNGEFQWQKNIVSNYSPGPYSLPATDNQENIYFAVGKDVFALDKNGNEIWKILLANAPVNWYSVSEIGIALDKNEILYLSGRGAIFALK